MNINGESEMGIRELAKKIVYKEKYNIESYVLFLRKKGVKIGENNIIVDVQHLRVDLTRPYLLAIGSNNTLSDSVTILTHDYSWSVVSEKYPGEIYPVLGKVEIGDNCFIGSHTTILPNVKIGNNVIVGACSLVNRNLPDDTVCAGVPARVICSLEEYKEKIKRRSTDNLDLMISCYREIYSIDPDEWELREHLTYFYNLKEIKEKNPNYYYHHRLDKCEKLELPTYDRGTLKRRIVSEMKKE
jgi:acetyltransferase-like isoleucine patch superfamily enzyme